MTQLTRSKGQGLIVIGAEGDRMPKIRLGSNATIFVLFFGVSLLEAFQNRNWLKALFWLAIGVVFLFADSFNRPSKVG